MTDRLSAYAPQALAVLRIVTALLFLLHGTQKILGFPAFGQPPIMSMFGAAGIIEIVTGILIILGFFTRPAAFIASGTMAVAYWMVHAPGNLFPSSQDNGGEAAILFCFIFLYLVFAGPGAWSINKK